MKTLKLFPIMSIFLVVLCFSCAPKMATLQPTGDIAQIKIDTEEIITGQLLTIDIHDIYLQVDRGIQNSELVSKGLIYNISTDCIESITIEGYTNDNWIAPLILLEVIPIGLLGAAAASVEDVDPIRVIAVLSMPAFLNYLFLKNAHSAPKVAAPFTELNMSELKKYARFPQGLTPTQLTTLLATINQAEILELK